MDPRSNLLAEFQNKMSGLHQMELASQKQNFEKKMEVMKSNYEEKLHQMEVELQNTMAEMRALKQENKELDQENKNLKFIIQQSTKQITLTLKTLSVPVNSKQFATLYKLANNNEVQNSSMSTPTKLNYSNTSTGPQN